VQLVESEWVRQDSRATLHRLQPQDASNNQIPIFRRNFQIHGSWPGSNLARISTNGLRVYDLACSQHCGIEIAKIDVAHP